MNAPTENHFLVVDDSDSQRTWVELNLSVLVKNDDRLTIIDEHGESWPKRDEPERIIRLHLAENHQEALECVQQYPIEFGTLDCHLTQKGGDFTGPNTLLKEWRAIEQAEQRKAAIITLVTSSARQAFMDCAQCAQRNGANAAIDISSADSAKELVRKGLREMLDQWLNNTPIADIKWQQWTA